MGWSIYTCFPSAMVAGTVACSPRYNDRKHSRVHENVEMRVHIPINTLQSHSGKEGARVASGSDVRTAERTQTAVQGNDIRRYIDFVDVQFLSLWQTCLFCF